MLSSLHRGREQQRRMAQQNSFDIVSEVDRAEVMNAVNQTMKEVRQRFDFKDSKAAVALEEKDLVLTAEDDTKLRNMNDILQQKLVSRGSHRKRPKRSSGSSRTQRRRSRRRFRATWCEFPGRIATLCSR